VAETRLGGGHAATPGFPQLLNGGLAVILTRLGVVVIELVSPVSTGTWCGLLELVGAMDPALRRRFGECVLQYASSEVVGSSDRCAPWPVIPDPRPRGVS
jgi:hypothetical protein